MKKSKHTIHIQGLVWLELVEVVLITFEFQYNSHLRHMKEHMDVPIDTSNMSEQELQFHYFKMHDSDGNNKLGK